MNSNKNLAVSPIVEMKQTNEKIIIYNGIFFLKIPESKTIEVDGEIYFKWFPHIAAKFSGIISNEEYVDSLFDSDRLQLIINEEIIGDCYISSQNIGGNSTITGGFYDKVVLGDKSLVSQKFKFSVLNFDDFLGDIIKYKTESRVTHSRARIHLKNDKFEILIDKDVDYKNKFESLKENGGYHILHNGEINFYKKALNFGEIGELINILGHFLSFVSGKKNIPLFVAAIHNNEILYQDFTGYHNYPYEFRPTWSDTYQTDYFSDLFLNFYNLWKSDTNNKFFLKSIIHWYTEINCNSGYSEGALIMAQTALELLYNWLVIENKKLIIGKDSENISASNKMRLLISQLSISYTIPEKFESLEKYRSDSKLPDAIEAIVQIRNAIVHSQEEKRKKLSEISSKTIYEAVQLCTWYIELSLLYILKFEDKYSNRCSKEIVKSYKLESLPWK
ncbi:hypothetical protein CMT47_19540 [Elizabethkingia anophelis]|nr:hypothetical protein [Elizabethkingia anophelis]MDV4088319.1 hypothetical protein [Elizabethkingia anophelis]